MNRFGFFSMILLCLNSMIGPGLFLLPAKISFLAGNWSLLIYLSIALLTMAIAWNFTQCASLFTRSGGSYLYAKQAFGSFIGFEIGLMRWTVTIISWAALSVGFTTVLATLVPSLTPFVRPVAVILILFFGLVNLFGVRTLKILNNIFTLAKLIPLLILTTLGFIFFSPTFEEFPPIQSGAIGSAALLIFFAFSGFEILTAATAEMDNPKKNIPRAVPIAIGSAALLYLFIQTICLATLGSTPCATPIASVANLFIGPVGALCISVASLVAITGGLFSMSFISPRSATPMAEDGLIFPSLMRQNRFGSPHLSILISTLLASAVALIGDFAQLAALSVLPRFIQYISTVLALLVFSRKKILNPFNRRWKRAIPLFSLCGIIFLIFQAEPSQLIIGLSGLFVGVPLYFSRQLFKSLRKI